MTPTAKLQNNIPVSYPKKEKQTFQEIAAPYADDLAYVNKIISNRYSNSLPLIKEVGFHHFQSGGKRIRPLLTLIFAHALEASVPRAANLAACIELIHAASLMHDDVLDESSQRRGQASVNALWNNRISILAGDYLFSQAFGCMVEDGSPEIYKILAWASSTITEGELHQISIQRDLTISFTDYEAVNEKKTAALFQAACSLAGSISNITSVQKSALNSFGKSFGHIFQLVDDYLDYMGDANKLGKRLGNDLREGKVTFPVLYTYQKGSKKEKIFWENLFLEDSCPTENDMQQVFTLLKQYDTESALMTLLQEHKNQAQQDLSCLKNSKHKQALLDLIDFVINRHF